MANTIRIDPNVHARLKRLAKKLGMNPHPLASAIIDAYIKGGLFVPPMVNKHKASEEAVS
jgi:predicted transcriptional regulator